MHCSTVALVVPRFWPSQWNSAISSKHSVRPMPTSCRHLINLCSKLILLT